MPKLARRSRFLVATLLVALAAFAARADDAKIPWRKGPAELTLADQAVVRVPAGFLVTGKDGTKKLLELTGNLVSGDEVGAIVPEVSADSLMWFAIFEYRNVGHVSDSDKDSIDAGRLLKTLQEGNAHANEERRRRHLPTMTITGWERPPSYDSETHDLTWALLGVSDSGGVSVNHSVRILGRGGTMSVDLVLAPALYARVLPSFDSLITTFRFRDGRRYADFTKGDKVAAFGLTALIAGGVGAVAAKTGLLAGLGKFLFVILLALKKAIVVVVLGIVAFFRKLFGGIRKAVNPTEDVPKVEDGPKLPGT